MRRTPPAAQTPRHPTQIARDRERGGWIGVILEQQIPPLAGKWVGFNTDLAPQLGAGWESDYFASCQFAPTFALQRSGTLIGTR